MSVENAALKAVAGLATVLAEDRSMTDSDRRTLESALAICHKKTLRW